MAALESCPKHNMVVYLEKYKRNAQFHEIFWNSTTSKIVNNASYIKAKVVGKAVSIFEASIRRGLLFNDADGIGCHITTLFPNILSQAEVAKGEGSELPTEPQSTSSPTQPNIGDQPPLTKSSSRHDTNQLPMVNLDGSGGSERDQVNIPHDSPLSGGQTFDRAEGVLNLDEWYVPKYTYL
ncbi:hypothetical protein Tco_0300393 [Tanacetum coccineum]